MNRVFKLLLFFIIPLLPALAWALVSDGDNPVYIVTGSSVYNLKTGVNVFDGHVKVDQGDTHLTADRLVTKRNSNKKMEVAIAYGDSDLAHYWTTPKTGEPLHAKAKIIRFYPPQSLIVLENDVLVSQGGNSFKGPMIVYNMKNQIITVPTSQHGHATIVYDPESKSLP